MSNVRFSQSISSFLRIVAVSRFAIEVAAATAGGFGLPGPQQGLVLGGDPSFGGQF